MDLVIQSCIAELDKIAESQTDRRKKWRNRALAAGGLALGGLAAHRMGRRAVDSVSTTFANKIEAGVRRGVESGFEKGVKGLRSQAPDMADDVMRRVRPEINSIIEEAARRAHAEAPGLGEAVAEGFSGAVKKRIPWRR
jgi:hypothetical protein